jgi:hypothetical protein
VCVSLRRTEKLLNAITFAGFDLGCEVQARFQFDALAIDQNGILRLDKGGLKARPTSGHCFGRDLPPCKGWRPHLGQDQFTVGNVGGYLRHRARYQRGTGGLTPLPVCLGPTLHHLALLQFAQGIGIVG